VSLVRCVDHVDLVPPFAKPPLQQVRPGLVVVQPEAKGGRAAHDGQPLLRGRRAIARVVRVAPEPARVGRETGAAELPVVRGACLEAEEEGAFVSKLLQVGERVVQGRLAEPDFGRGERAPQTDHDGRDRVGGAELPGAFATRSHRPGQARGRTAEGYEQREVATGIACEDRLGGCMDEERRYGQGQREPRDPQRGLAQPRSRAR